MEEASEPVSVDVGPVDAADRQVPGFAVGDSTIAKVIDLSHAGISAIMNLDIIDGEVQRSLGSSHCMLISLGQSYLPEKLLPIGGLNEYFIQNIKFNFHPAFKISC